MGLYFPENVRLPLIIPLTACPSAPSTGVAIYPV